MQSREQVRDRAARLDQEHQRQQPDDLAVGVPDQRPPSRRVTFQVVTSVSRRVASVTWRATDTAVASSSQVNRTVILGAPRTTLRSEASSVVSAAAAAAAAGSTDCGATPRRSTPTAMITRNDGIRPGYAAGWQVRRRYGGQYER